MFKNFFPRFAFAIFLITSSDETLLVKLHPIESIDRDIGLIGLDFPIVQRYLFPIIDSAAKDHSLSHCIS